MKVLHIITSPRGDNSLSRKLGNDVVKKVKLAYPVSDVKEVNLATMQFPHLEEAHINSFFTPSESRSPEQIDAIKHSSEAVKDLKDADIIVIDAPMYNFFIPSPLKAWIDHIVRAGETFKYDENGVQGLLKGKKVYLAESTGNIYSEGPAKQTDFGTPYLQFILGFIGLDDIEVFRIEGVALPGIQDTAVQKGLDSVVIN